MTDRMRKVNELLREVLSEAVLELKDPRIGFVTMTGVRTSRISATRRCTSACSAPSASASARSRGCEAAHGVLQARIGREVRMKRTPTLTFEYDPTVEEGVRMSKLIDELAPEDELTSPPSRPPCATTTASCSSRTRTPTGTRSARSSA